MKKVLESALPGGLMVCLAEILVLLGVYIGLQNITSYTEEIRTGVIVGHDSAESGTWVFKRLFLGRGGEHDGCTDEESLSCVCDALCFVLCVDLVSIQILSQTVFFKSEILGGARILWEFILYYGAVRIMYWLCMWSYPGGEKEVGLCVISDKYFSLRDRNFPGGREIHGLS